MSIAAWLAATRPKTLPAAAVPVAVGTACGAQGGTVPWLAVGGCLVGGLLIQIGCNFANDAFDAIKGADTDDRVGPQRAVASGLISARSMLVATAIVLGIAFAIGLWLAGWGGWPIIALGVASVIAAVGYTAGPVPLAYVGLGDLFVLLFFGYGATLGTAWVVHHAGTPGVDLGHPLLLAMPWWWWALATGIGLQATAILQVNNIRDQATDILAGKRTLVVRLGDRGGRLLYATTILAAAIAIALSTLHSLWLWLPAGGALLAAILLIITIRRRSGAALNPYLARTALAELITGASIVVALSL